MYRSCSDNYDATATIEGSCEYLGCTSFAAYNFDPNANVNDGSCEFLSCVGCLNAAYNYARRPHNPVHVFTQSLDSTAMERALTPTWMAYVIQRKFWAARRNCAELRR